MVSAPPLMVRQARHEPSAAVLLVVQQAPHEREGTRGTPDGRPSVEEQRAVPPPR